ncbi:DNA-directed RNA polymerase subunit beta [Virgibacillus oceani]|uniref:DNA-directed RNA polymerase subunit beta n=1 Tax=Virgibacillus oceani TaxID=1479511 RepID=A0A917HQ16_9BACI|nr:DNA-directed RNA polymerase subunit beta [Virgibacillus oceani]GGG86043.1 hypothetical protein GCM10011398_34760 [Virgibacillus oceani]
MSTNQSEKAAVEEQPKRGLKQLKDLLKKLKNKLKDIYENKLKRKPKTEKENETGNAARRKQKQKEEKQIDAGAETDVVTRKQQKKKQKEEKRLNKKPRRRIFPIWLRIIVVLIFCAVALVVGLMVGYGVIGDGKPSDVLEMDTWQHIIDIVKKEK